MRHDLPAVTGTLIWYYHICKRQVWLIAHQITPDQDNTNIAIGRFYDQEYYKREKKSLFVDHNVIDVFHEDDGRLVVGEIKKSSSFQESARMQLAFYLKRLRANGIEALGELRFPAEKRRQTVVLDEELAQQLEEVEAGVRDILVLMQPPPAEKSRFCKNCGYVEFCWS